MFAAAVLIAACGGASDDAGPATTSSSPPVSSGTAASTVPSVPPSDRPSSTTSPNTATISTTTTTTTTTTPVPTAAECVAALPVEWKAAQIVMPAIDGAALDAAADVVAAHDLGAVLLLRWPDGSDPVALAAVRAASTTPLMIAVDEEGGIVQRLRQLGELPSAREVASTMTPDEAQAMIAAHGAAVADLGIDVVFAPVVDVAPPGGGGPIGSRAFADDPLIVAEFTQAYVDGWSDVGVLPVLKHFPGHGAASADTHEARAMTAPIDDLRARDLVPYAAIGGGSGVGVMVGHLDVPGLTDDGLPTSLSAAAIGGELRGRLGYADALVFSDALGMDAVTAVADLPDAAVLAIAAGTDVAVFTDLARTGEVVDGLVVAVADGRLEIDRIDDAVGRLLDHKAIDPCALAV